MSNLTGSKPLTKTAKKQKVHKLLIGPLFPDKSTPESLSLDFVVKEEIY